MGLLYMIVNYSESDSVGVHSLGHVYFRMIVLDNLTSLKNLFNFPLFLWEENQSLLFAHGNCFKKAAVHEVLEDV